MVSEKTVHAYMLLQRLGLVSAKLERTRIVFDLPESIKHKNTWDNLVTWDAASGMFNLQFPYRYPSFCADGDAEVKWQCNADEVIRIFERLCEYVEQQGYSAASTGKFLRYFIIGGKKGADFSDEPGNYTMLELLNLTKVDLPAINMFQLLWRAVPVSAIQRYDPARMPLSLLLELYPEPEDEDDEIDEDE